MQRIPSLRYCIAINIFIILAVTLNIHTKLFYSSGDGVVSSSSLGVTAGDSVVSGEGDGDTVGDGVGVIVGVGVGVGVGDGDGLGLGDGDGIGSIFTFGSFQGFLSDGSVGSQ